MKKISVEVEEIFTTDSPIFRAAKLRRMPLSTLLQTAVDQAKPMLKEIVNNNLRFKEVKK